MKTSLFLLFFNFLVNVVLSEYFSNDFDSTDNNIIHPTEDNEYTLDNSIQPTKSSSKSKTEMLADIFKKKVGRMKSHLETELIILVDGSSSIGDINFRSEMKFIQKMISDVNVGPNTVRLGVITYSSVVVTHVNHLKSEPEDYEKCLLLHYQLPSIKYKGGATNTKDALLEAKKILSNARPSAQKVVFLVTDGFSNRGNPMPIADSLKQDEVFIYTFGIENGNVEELHKIASRPIQEHSYLFESFGEFEGFERRALHQDLKAGVYAEVKNASLCDLLCDEGKTDGCCADEAKCSCGKFSGHFACLCPPGYYGSGLRDQGCKPCPNGTYSDGTIPGDVVICFPCPDKNHITTKTAATSMDDCTCVDGYIKDGKKCKVITCPEITPPNNGYFVKKNCSNILNAACGIRCHMGFTLRGSSVRICQKNGTWSGTPPSCTPKRCKDLKPVSNAEMICANDEDNFEVVTRYNGTGEKVKHFIKRLELNESNVESENLQEFDTLINDTVVENYTVGTECTYACAEGYFLVGSKTRSCLPMLKWSGLKNTCKAVKCHSLQTIANGIVMPLNCTEKGLKHHFADACYYSCNAGYELIGAKVTNCTGRHGAWSGKNNPTKCSDVEAPHLVCPSNVTVPTDEGVHFATLKLSLPNATDNSGKEPMVWSKPPFEDDYPLRFIIGDSEIQIYSVDDSGNYAFCTFNVTVEDRESPVILECESPPIFFTSEFEPNSTEIKWKEPVVDDNSGVPIPLKRVPTSSDFPLGTTTITYTAIDYSGNNASCKINITILENPCSERPEITNTLWNCSSESDYMRCNVSCSEGYTFLSHSNSSTLELNCTYSGRKASWSPDLFHGDIDLFPECSEIETPTEIEGEVIIDGSDEICDALDELSNEISNEISSTADNETIPIFAVCEDESPESDLEKEKEEEKLEEDTNVIRKKREMEEKPQKKRKRKKLRIGFSLKGKYKGNMTDEEFLKGLTKTQKAVKDFYAKHESENRPELVIKTNVRLKCKEGFLLKENVCVKCPKGTFHNVETSTCDPCPIGQYQEVEGQMRCIPCPEGFSTRKIRRKHVKQCKKICPPGTFGRRKTKIGIALSPCVPCPIGEYQPLSGQISCEKCPEDFITPKKASKSSHECVRKEEFDNLCFRFHCRNGGTCFVTDGFAVCKCPTGFLGAFCERRFNPCASLPCYNSAECVTVNTVEYECKCLPGFEGIHCEKEINECSSNPCGGHGECVDLFGAYRCNCFPGFKGENCSERISMCEELQPCLNSGTCTEVGTSYKCFCPEEYTGSHCEELIEEIEVPEVEIFSCQNVSCGEKEKCVEQWNGQPVCVCAEGFRGETCDEMIDPHKVLHFPKYGVTEYLLADLPPSDLNEISICVWIQTRDNFNYGTLFSYSTLEHDNAFTLTDYSGLVLYVSGYHVVTDLTANDGFWHFICVTWKSNNGEWQIYLDGIRHTSGSGLATGSVITGGGKLVVGQEQDLFGGGFNELESFSGRLIYFDVWSRVLQESEVKSLHENCVDTSGDLITWTQLLQNINGNIREEDSEFCKTCSENLTLFRGQISYEFFDQHINAKYECEEGFQLKFDGLVELNSKNLKFWYRKCMKYGNWEWEKPICSRVSCGFPGYFLNGKISNSTYLYGDIIQYECENGYTLLGDNTRICQADGTWSGKVPFCQGDSNNCRKLVAPRHGSMFVYFNQATPYGKALPAVGDRIEFTCDTGYNLQGFSLLTCLEGGVWDREAPYCEDIKCQYPKEASHFLPKNLPQNATFYYGDALPIICPSKVKQMIVCGEFGSWNFSKNICGAQCLEKPEAPDNGYVILDGRREYFNEGETLSVKCKPGFILLGETRVTCSEYGTWSQSRPSTCEPVSCGPPPPAPFPYLIAHEEGYRFGQKVYLECAPGYRKTGDIITVCEANGIWSRIQNTCTQV